VLKSLLSESEMTVSNMTTSNMSPSASVNSGPIYGIEADFEAGIFTRIEDSIGLTPGANFNSVNAYGGRRRCILTDGGIRIAYYGDAGYTEGGTLTEQIIYNGTTYPIGTRVQTMVEQPKFYYSVVPITLSTIPDYSEVNRANVNSGCTANGNITITLNNIPFVVPVLSTDNTDVLLATKLRAATYAGWTVGGTETAIRFTSIATGALAVVVPVNVGSTGANISITKIIYGGTSKGSHLLKARYYISDTPRIGFKLHPAFIRNSIVKDRVYLSAYESSVFDVSADTYLIANEQVADFNLSTGDKLSSIGGVKIATGTTQVFSRPNFRKLITNRGAGWQLPNLLTISATQLLFAIEYCGFNSQTLMGKGVVDKPVGTGNESELTGTTTSLGNNSGSATGVDGLVSISYRGEENFWGNTLSFTDGVNVEGNGLGDIWYSDHDFTDGIKTSPYISIGFTPSKINGRPIAFGYSNECDFAFIPSKIFGTTSQLIGDSFTQSHVTSGFLVSLFGGFWYNGTDAGSYQWVFNGTTTTRHRAYGTRIVFM
jgi:hypothetical protein